MPISTIELVAPIIRNAKNIVVFTGAGMSAESNISTFRDDDGFWKRFPVDQFATWQGISRTAFRRPAALIDFIHEVISPIAVAKPNAGHLAIERLEHHKPVSVITQNIDGLHQAAGNTVVHEIHGSLFEVVSLKGRFRNLVSRVQLQRIAKRIHQSKRGPLKLARLAWAIRPWLGVGVRGLHRPNLVLFGDALAEPDWQMSCEAVTNCDCLIKIGCSGTVYPAAALPAEAKATGATIVAIDPRPTAADHWLQGPAAEVLPQLIDKATAAP